MDGTDEMDDVGREVKCVRTSLGLWLRDDHTFVRFAGKDAASWLQSQTTNDALALESAAGHRNAALDRQGRLQAHFTLHRWEDEYWMLIERAQAPHLLKHLDDHLFIEDVQFQETGDELDQVVIQGPATLPFLAHVIGADHIIANELLPRLPHGVHPVELAGVETIAFRESSTGEDGYVLVMERGRGEALLDELDSLAREHGVEVARVGAAAREVLRIEAGIPKFGVDIDSTNVVAETTLERDAVSYTKGCYLGQEVVARLKTYGSPKRALVGLIFHDAGGFIGDITSGGSVVGCATSSCFSPTLGAHIAIAAMGREHRAPGTQVTAGGADAEVRALPIYEARSREDLARDRYTHALELFERDPEDTDASAIPLLEEALLFDPAFEDAYEVLGVILHRHGRTDDAIRVMRQLVERNPACLMAHTNLSVFYVAKGMIPEAEEEKAKAAVLQIERAGAERRAREVAESERKRLENEARDRIRMFREVLEIDPEDPLATFGLGKAHIQLNQFADALPYLERATQLQRDYSAAFLDLGKCHEFLGHAEEAAATYRAGIAVASRKGDLMPMREMERRLKALESGGVTRTSESASR